MEDLKKNKDNCPYLMPNEIECKVTDGGLYLPMPEHIEMFCKDTSFIHCRYYLKGCELCRENARVMGIATDEKRRRYQRVQERLSLLLAQCSPSGKQLNVLDNEAYTIDLSLGGFRFESKNKIPTNERIAFSFGDDFATPAWQGVGEVRWINYRKDSNGFQAGLTFTDNKTFQAVGRHMGLPEGLPMM